MKGSLAAAAIMDFTLLYLIVLKNRLIQNCCLSTENDMTSYQLMLCRIYLNVIQLNLK
jgi:hypothetical protein